MPSLKNIYDVICPTFISQWKVKSNKPVSEQAYEKDYKPPSRSRFQPLLAEVDMTEADTDSEKLTHFTPTCRDGDGVASESTKPCSPSHTRATGRGEKSSIKDDKLSELMDIYSSMAVSKIPPIPSPLRAYSYDVGPWSSLLGCQDVVDESRTGSLPHCASRTYDYSGLEKVSSLPLGHRWHTRRFQPSGPPSILLAFAAIHRP